jgi:hypothetical protein
MKLGAIHLWGKDSEKFRSEIRLCHALGYDHFSLGDSPAARMCS